MQVRAGVRQRCKLVGLGVGSGEVELIHWKGKRRYGASSPNGVSMPYDTFQA